MPGVEGATTGAGGVRGAGPRDFLRRRELEDKGAVSRRPGAGVAARAEDRTRGAAWDGRRLFHIAQVRL